MGRRPMPADPEQRVAEARAGRRTAVLYVRTHEERLAAWRAAADDAGIPLAWWVEIALDAAARRL